MRQEKYFWCVRIAVASTSGGRPCGQRLHEIGVDRAGKHDRKLDEAGHLVEQPRVGLDDEPQFRRAAVETGARSFRLRRSWSSTTWARFELVDDSRRHCRPQISPGARKRWPRVVRPTGTRPSGQRQHFAVEQADDRGQRPHPAQRRAPASASISARAARRSRPSISPGSTSAVGRPGPLDDREIKFAAAGVADLALLDRAEPRRAQKTVDRRLRRADPRPAPLIARSGCTGGMPAAMTASRRGVT